MQINYHLSSEQYSLFYPIYLAIRHFQVAWADSSKLTNLVAQGILSRHSLNTELSLSNRVFHFIIGVGECIPGINLVIAWADYFFFNQDQTNSLSFATNSLLSIQYPIEVQSQTTNNVSRAIRILEMRLASLKPSKTSYVQSGLSLFFLIGILLRAMPKSNVGAFIEKLGLKGMKEKEIHQALHEIQQDLNKTQNPKIVVANAVVAPPSKINPSFNKAIKQFYFAESLPPDKDEINNWVKGKTNGLIPKLFDEFRKDQNAFMNTLYFNGQWENEFNPKNTEKGIFTTMDGEKIPTQIMSQRGSFNYYQGKGFQVLQKPYISSKGDLFTYTIYLPQNGANINQLEKQLTPEFIANCQNKMSMTRDIQVFLPKTDLKTNDRELIQGLKKLGFPIPDTLDRFNGDPLEEIGQVCCVKGDEKGTQAAAVTYAMTRECAFSIPPPKLVFDARSPFIAHISNKNHTYFQMALKDKKGLVS